RTFAVCLLAAAAAAAQGAGPRPASPRVTSATLSALRPRSVGPGIVSGRIVSLAVVPGHASTYYVAAASGGVWKTTNDGATFTPIFDHEGSYSIGTIELDPNHPDTLWVGTGENNSQRTVSYGDGIYRSDDGGRTWRNLGLHNSRHIGKIVIDPRDSNTVYVAAEGPLWTSGGDRGVFKTTDGGKTWTNVLSVNEHTGASDLAMDPRNPDVIYAATYQRERHVYTLIDGGPGSGIYKSTDAGKTWTRLRNGLPRQDLGRIGLAISPANPGIIYATVEAADRSGGVYRSTDGGASWEKRNPIQSGAMYYAQIVADPAVADRVYELDTTISVSNDGGRTFAALGEPNKHVDNHVLWIDPANDNHYLDGCDGGLYESWDRAASWEWKTNLPLGQYVDVTVDNAAPFYDIYGGTQDNQDEGGPSRTYSSNGLTSADWRITHGGDGFHNAVDPTNPNIVYSESQGGVLDRVNLHTHEVVGIQPQPGPGEAAFRWGWDVPFFVSPFDHNRLYMAANKVFRSDDRGNSWKEISGDLTQALDRDAQPVMGRIWGPDAVAKNSSTAPYGKMMDIAESPKQQGLLYAGTDDGLVQMTADDGGHWTKYNKFPGVPDGTLVSRILPSQTDANTVYVAFENHKNGDFKPYLLKSSDRGATWTSIAANLPENGPVLALAQDDADGNLLFAGTEFGLYTSLDGGGQWIKYPGLPTIAVRDLAIQRREHDLVIGTFGRGIYILDDYTPLRHLGASTLDASGEVLPSRPALEYLQLAQYGGSGKSDNGAAFFTAQNLGPVALISYWIKSVPQTDRQKLQNRERSTERSGGNFSPYPTPAEVTAMNAQAPPAYSLIISDATGHPIRVLAAPARAGLGRISWDLRSLASP
ncbi:MAG: WD40/YVTN/BNR-like repeat-containing protein, partial [Terriglobales bacterium]